MIIVNARFLTQEITGVQRFAIELSKKLKEKLGDKIQFVTCGGVIHKRLYEELNTITIGHNRGHFWEQIDLLYFLISRQKPLLLSFGSTGPLFYKNQIISVHDMAFKYYKQTFSKSFSLTYNFLVPRISKKCNHVLTVSESSKVDICKELKLPKNKVTVIYNGVSDVFKKNSEIDFIPEESRPYILSVSSHHPRKNYSNLIQAFKTLEEDVDLYIIGNFINHFSSNLKSPNLNDKVKFLTGIDDKKLKTYYANAKLFVFPSLYEGFGIPVVEAMSQGRICVLSDIPVFREIGNEEVIFVDPKNVSSIAKGIQKGLAIKDIKPEYPKLKRFSWELSSQKVINLVLQYA